MSIPITKYHVCGNDFIVVDRRCCSSALPPLNVTQLADRRKGVGFDQLLILKSPQRKLDDVHMDIYNADGSEAVQCGNGCLAVADLLFQEYPTKFSLQIGLKHMSVQITSSEPASNYTITLCPPIFRPDAIPFASIETGPQHTIRVSPNSTETIEAVVLSVGNPHAVVFVDNVDAIDLDRLGSSLQVLPAFPDSVNVELLECASRSTGRVRIYERGVGETLACGSGVAAAMVAGRVLHHFDQDVQLSTPGGTLRLKWEKEADPVYLTGRATLVYKAELFL